MESEIIKIHPYDFLDLLNSLEIKDSYLYFEKDNHGNDIHEINGKKYFQTTDVPAVSKNWK